MAHLIRFLSSRYHLETRHTCLGHQVIRTNSSNIQRFLQPPGSTYRDGLVSCTFQRIKVDACFRMRAVSIVIAVMLGLAGTTGSPCSPTAHSRALLPPSQNELAHDRLRDAPKQQHRRHPGVGTKVGFAPTPTQTPTTTSVAVPPISEHCPFCCRWGTR